MSYPEPSSPYVSDEASIMHDVREELAQMNTEHDKLTKDERRRLEALAQAITSMGAPIRPLDSRGAGEVIARAARFEEFIREGRE